MKILKDATNVCWLGPQDNLRPVSISLYISLEGLVII